MYDSMTARREYYNKRQKKKNEEYSDKITQFANELAKLTDETRFNKKFLDFIETQKHFWHYSLNNQILINIQCSKATRVTGFKSWKKLGRHVKKGSKAIKIFAPVTLKNKEKVIFTYPDGHLEFKYIRILEEESIQGFRLVNVFDISQTEGKALPEAPDHRRHTDTRPDILRKIETLIRSKNINLIYSDNLNGANGMTDGKSIYILNSLSTDDKIQTGIHELLHYTQHFKDDGGEYTKKQKEIEAEATSYIISRILGLQSQSYNYIALYNGSGEEILNSLNRISGAIKDILNQLSKIKISSKQETLVIVS